MSLTEWSALLLLFAAASFTPGPNTTLTAALAANRGLRGSLRFVCAVPTGWVLLLLLCGAGLGGLVLAVPWLYWAILLVGVAYMFWLAARLARSGRLTQADERHLDVGFFEGVWLQFVNVKVWLLVLVVVAGWVAGHANWPVRLAWAVLLVLLFGFSSNFAYALIGSLLRDWLAQGWRLLWFNRAMALALVLTALWMLGSAQPPETQRLSTAVVPVKAAR